MFPVISLWSNEFAFSDIIYINAWDWINHNRGSATVIHVWKIRVPELQPVFIYFFISNTLLPYLFTYLVQSADFPKTKPKPSLLHVLHVELQHLSKKIDDNRL